MMVYGVTTHEFVRSNWGWIFGGGILWVNPRTQQEMLSLERKLEGSILTTCVAGSLRHAV